MPNRAIIQAKRLLDIRTGPGSVVLPADVVGLQLAFSQRNANGHMGARKFAQENLPRIQFHNPTLNIEVERTKDLKDPKNERIKATMRILRQGEQTDEVQDIRGLHSNDILAKLIASTGAEQVSDAAGSAVIA